MIALIATVAAETATVPGSHADVVQACLDTAVDRIEVDQGAPLGTGICDLARDVEVVGIDGPSLPPFKITGGATVSIDAAFIEATSAQNIAIYVQDSTANLSSLDLGDNTSGGYGLYIRDAVVAANSVNLTGFDGNPAVYVTGASEGAELTFTGGKIHDNVDYAVHISGTRPSVVSFESTTFSANNTSHASPIRVDDGELTLLHVVADGNSGTDGGLVSTDFGQAVVIEGGSYRGHEGGQRGGVVLASNSTLSVDGATFVNNQADAGGALYVLQAAADEVHITNSVFCSNQGADGGAAIHVELGVVVLDHVLLHDHSDGSAFQGSALSSLEVTHVSAIGNDRALDPGTLPEFVVRDTLFWENEVDVGSGFVNGEADHNAWDAEPVWDGTGDVELSEYPFVSDFAVGQCETLPLLLAGSPPVGAASDGSHIGAYPAVIDTGIAVDSGDSGVPVDSDEPAVDTGLPTARVDWLGGGCGGGAGAVLLLLCTGAVFRRRHRPPDRD